MSSAKPAPGKTPARYVGQAAYDGQRALTPKQIARAKETVRRAKEAKAPATADIATKIAGP